MPFDKNKYDQEYNKEHIRRKFIPFNIQNPDDCIMLEWLGKQGYLVTSAHGERVTRTTWRVLWNSYVHSMETAINGVDRRWYGRTREHKKILEDGGKLPEWIPFAVVPYDLRCSFATFCRNMTPPIEIHTVIAWMGHADAKMILKVYDSVTEDRDRTEAERLKQALKP